MIGATASDFLLIGFGALVTAGLGAIAWFFRQWANGVGDKVDDLKTDVGELRDDVGETKVAVGQLQVAVGWPPHLRIGSGRAAGRGRG